MLAFHVLIYVLEGVIYVTEDGTDHVVEAGGLLFLKKGVHHFGKTEIPRGTRWYYVHFYTDRKPEGEKEAASVSGTGTGEDAGDLRCITLPKELSQLAGSAIEEKIAAFIECARSDEGMNKWYLNMRLFELLSRIAFYEQKESKRTLSEEICVYLQAHRQEPFSAGELERHFYLSYKYMAAVFKKEKQMTMQQYHTKQRIDAACRLLESTLLPVGEIGRQLGYEDMLYFSRVFHQSKAMSPTAYRKRAMTLY